MLHIDVKTLMLLLHEDAEGALQQSHYLQNKEIDKAYCQYYMHVAYEDLTQNRNYYPLRSLTTTKHSKLGNFHDVPFLPSATAGKCHKYCTTLSQPWP
jgi:hypothetical protein